MSKRYETQLAELSKKHETQLAELSEKYETQLAELSKKIVDWFDALAWFLVPPFSELQGDFLMERLRSDLDVDAAALFLAREDDPSQLEFRFGAGYRKEYRDKVYFLNQPALTSYVFSRKEAINMSAEALHAERDNSEGTDESIPFTGACQEFIDTGEFKNIVAAPVVFEGNRLGVLKLENKKDTRDSDRFPPEDFTLIQSLAAIIAILCQQRVYTQLWTDGERAIERCRFREEYLGQVSQIVCRALKADCCSVFVKEEDPETREPVLMYGGGVGYTSEYRSHVYMLPVDAGNAKSLTAHIAASRSAFRGTEESLIRSKRPYTGACRKYITSGTFRNILGIALVDSPEAFGNVHAQCLGVMKVENKKPEGTDFGKYDEEVCRAFVTRQIVPALASKKFGNQKRKRSVGQGYKILERELGKSQPLSGAPLMKRFEEALRLKASNGEISYKNCIEYLQMPRASFYRKKAEIEKGRAD